MCRRLNSFQSTLNDTYWDRVDHAVSSAEALGITCLICPFYLGYTGTWEVIETDTVGGGAVHCYTCDYPLKAVRARITTDASGGADPGVTVEVLRTVATN